MIKFLYKFKGINFISIYNQWQRILCIGSWNFVSYLNTWEKDDYKVRLLNPFIHAHTFQWINQIRGSRKPFHLRTKFLAANSLARIQIVLLGENSLPATWNHSNPSLLKKTSSTEWTVLYKKNCTLIETM